MMATNGRGSLGAGVDSRRILWGWPKAPVCRDREPRLAVLERQKPGIEEIGPLRTPQVNPAGYKDWATRCPISKVGMKTDIGLSEFWQMKNGRSICIHETEDLRFVAFGYLDGGRKKGFRDLGRYETLQLAVETCGAFLCTIDARTFRAFRNRIAAGRFGSGRNRDI